MYDLSYRLLYRGNEIWFLRSRDCLKVLCQLVHFLSLYPYPGQVIQKLKDFVGIQIIKEHYEYGLTEPKVLIISEDDEHWKSRYSSLHHEYFILNNRAERDANLKVLDKVGFSPKLLPELFDLMSKLC